MSTVAQNYGFSSLEGDTKADSNTRKCSPWAYFFLPNFSRIGKGQWHKSPSNCENNVEIVIFRWLFASHKLDNTLIEIKI